MKSANDGIAVIININVVMSIHDNPETTFPNGLLEKSPGSGVGFCSVTAASLADNLAAKPA